MEASDDDAGRRILAELEDPNSFRAKLLRILPGTRFNFAMAALIVGNAILMGVEVDTSTAAQADDAKLSFVRYPPTDPETFRAFELIFTSLFFIELSLRAYALRSAFLRDVWCWIDTCALLPTLGDYLFENAGMKNFVLLRMVRILKLFRLLRLIRMFR